MPNVTNRQPPIVVTTSDVNNPNLLVRLLRTIVDKLASTGARVENVAGSIKIPTMEQISRSLSASGSDPINVTGLRGVLGDPQPAAAIRYPSVPVAQELQALKDTQLITVKNGTAYDLYFVLGGNPNTLFKLIGGASGGTMMTTDTAQTVTGFKTWDGGAASGMGITLGSNAGFTALIRFASAGVARWTLRKNATAESGADAGSDLELVRTNDGGGTNVNVLRVTRSDGSFDILSKILKLNGAQLQSFMVAIKNNAGTVQHAISTDGNNASVGNYAAKVTGASAAFNNTPQVNNVTAFTAGGGVDAATTNDFVLNVAAQTVGDEVFSASIVFNSTGTALTIDPIVNSINVNGTTQNRITLRVRNGLTGAAFPLTAASIGAGNQVSIRFTGHIF
jgi:hypothetical protein